MRNAKPLAFVQVVPGAKLAGALAASKPVSTRRGCCRFLVCRQPEWSRRSFLEQTGAILLGGVAAAVGGSRPAGAEVLKHAAPGYELHGDYHEDATRVVESMRTVTKMERGTPGMKEKVDATRKQMNDFVALYRRNPNIAGAVSFSTLYTAINTLAGHFASYGSMYPVPEKRRKRLEQQLNDVERALSRGR
jgi:photosystem II Psb27 protein